MKMLSLLGGQESIPFPGHELPSPALDNPRPVFVEPLDLSGWAGQIKEAWARGASGAMSLAKIVARAKAKLRRGEWTRLWHSQETPMPFRQRKAEMLAAIGKTMGDLKAHDRAHLPLAWLTLYILTALGRPLIEQLIAEGRIHPRITLIDAKSLVTEFKPDIPHNQPRPGVRLRISRFADFVRSTLPKWSLEQCDLARSELCQLLTEIEFAQPRHKALTL